MKDILGLGGIGTYELRKVACYQSGSLIVDTVFAVDTDYFETAISHPAYNEGAWVVVEEYTTKELAQIGHDKWVAYMSTPELPKELIDVSSAFFAKFLSDEGRIYTRKDD